MKSLRHHLQDADPLADEPLGPDEVMQMRRQLQAGLMDRAVSHRSRGRVLTAAAVTGGVALAGAVVLLRSPEPAGNTDDISSIDSTAPVEGTTPEESGLRRVYFETPGGTRVIWLFQPESSERYHP